MWVILSVGPQDTKTQSQSKERVCLVCPMEHLCQAHNQGIDVKRHMHAQQVQMAWAQGYLHCAHEKPTLTCCVMKTSVQKDVYTTPA